MYIIAFNPKKQGLPPVAPCAVNHVIGIQNLVDVMNQRGYICVFDEIHVEENCEDLLKSLGL